MDTNSKHPGSFSGRPGFAQMHSCFPAFVGVHLW